MGIPATELADRMPSSEYTMWRAYERVAHALPGEITPYILAQFAAMVANAMSKKGATQVEPKDFYPPIAPEEKTPDQLARDLKRKFGLLS